MIKHYENLNQEQTKGLLEIWEQSVKATHDFLDEKKFSDHQRIFTKCRF